MALPPLGGPAKPAAPQPVVPSKSVSRKPAPLITAHGEPKIGKTTFVGKLIQRALYIQTKNDITSPLVAACEASDGLIAPPKKILTIDERGLVDNDTGEVLIPGVWNALNEILRMYVDEGGYLNYDGIVLDEGNVLLDRIQAEMKASGMFVNRNGKQDDFAVYRGLGDLVRSWFTLPGRTGKPLGLVFHTGQPSVLDEGPLAGKLKAKAGPKAPSAAIGKEIAAQSSFVFRLVLSEKAAGPSAGLGSTENEVYTRKALTGAHPLYEQGCREPRLPSVIDIENTDVLAMLQSFGWLLPPEAP